VHAEPTFSAFDTAALEAAASAQGISIPRIEFPAESPSTNEALAQALAADPPSWPDFSVYGTDHQTAGRGRLGRTWTVPAGAALTFSTPYRIPSHARPDDLGWIALAAGIAVAEALRTAGVDAKIKWPNDVLAGAAEKKICGILVRIVDVDGRRWAIIGMGTNVSLSAAQLPVDTATSVPLEGGSVSREALAAEILARLQSTLGELFSTSADHAGDTAAARQITDMITTIGRRVRVELPDGTVFAGTATGLDRSGDLIVAGPDGERRVSAGDVVHASLA